MKIIMSILILSFSVSAVAGFSQISPEPAKKADVIFVVDDSGSMYSFQQKLEANLKSILSDFRHVDSQIGILTTTTEGNFTANTPGVFIGDNIQGSFDDKVAKIAENMKVGNQGAATEKAFDSVVLSLSTPLITTENQGFLRKNVPLYIVFVSDTDDQSEMNAIQFIGQLFQLKGDEDIHMYGFLVQNPTSTCNNEGTPVVKIPQAITYFNGKVFSMCDDDWSTHKIRYQSL